MSQAKSKIAVIGLGNIGNAVAANLVKGHRPVIVADRDLQKAQALSKKLGSLARPLGIADAIGEADIIVLAIWFNAIGEFMTQYNSSLKGKILVDPSNPIAPDEKGGFKKTIGEKESAGVLNKKYLPAGAKLAKALGTLGVASLTGAAFQKPEPAVLFYATDDTGINPAIEELIRDNGFEPGMMVTI
ncbi:MAG: NAD(P)-binding domain-containing protein [Puia sp.]|nr:NAD(P)-binding domain-containing protein [Puia sp.]